MHAIMRYHVPSLFSARVLTANAFSARTLVCPTPAMVKLAILSVLLRRDGPDRGQEHLDWLAPLVVAWAPPARMAVSAATVRVWKGDQPDEPLVMLAGLREYVHLEAPFGLALLDVPGERREDVGHGLNHLRALGTAESLVQPLGPPEWADELPVDFVRLDGAGESAGEVAALVDDLGTAPSFARLSVYRPAGSASVPRLGEDRRRVLLRLPLRVRRRTVDGYVVERLDG